MTRKSFLSKELQSVKIESKKDEAIKSQIWRSFMLTKNYFLKHMVKTQEPQRREVFNLLNISFGQGFHGKGHANQKTSVFLD